MLPDLVYSYNYAVHRSIKMKPAQVTADYEKQVWRTLYINGLPECLNKTKNLGFLRTQI